MFRKVGVEEVCRLRSSIGGILANSALWSMGPVFSVVVVVGGSEGVSSGIRTSQWSRGLVCWDEGKSERISYV